MYAPCCSRGENLTVRSMAFHQLFGWSSRCLGKEKIGEGQWVSGVFGRPFLYPNRRAAWTRSWFLPFAWTPYAEDSKPREMIWWSVQCLKAWPNPILCMREWMCVWRCRKLGFGDAVTDAATAHWELNDMAPNASGADFCNVVSWLLYPKAFVGVGYN